MQFVPHREHSLFPSEGPTAKFCTLSVCQDHTEINNGALNGFYLITYG